MKKGKEKPSLKKIICWNCDVEIIQYFDIKYKGERGVCPLCGANSPWSK
jgi:ribosomal protein L40E